MTAPAAPPPGTRITIRHVAADSGVSVAAVSKVLRNAYGVSEALRLNVQASIERLGYRPSVAARGMRGQTYTVGILLVNIDNPFLPQVIDGIHDKLAPSNYKSMLGIGRARLKLESEMVLSMIDNRMDGLILVAPMMPEKLLARFARQIPMVVIGHHEPTAADFDTINSDDRQGAARAVQALYDRGYRDIVMFSQEYMKDQQHQVATLREQGFRQAMQDLGIGPGVILRAPEEEGADVEAFRAFLARPDRPRAVFVWSDLHALVLLDQAHKAGLRVPEDLAIVGYDNSPVAGMSMVGLSSVEQHGRQLGGMATEALLSRIEGRKTPKHLYVTPEVIARSSV
jgi:LacI family transcriptional regulator